MNGNSFCNLLKFIAKSQVLFKLQCNLSSCFAAKNSFFMLNDSKLNLIMMNLLDVYVFIKFMVKEDMA